MQNRIRCFCLWCNIINIVHVLFKFGFIFPTTAAAVYSNQSESIREDLPVLQRLCPAAIFQKPLMKTLHSLFFYCIFIYTIPGVVIKYEQLLWLFFVQLFSSHVVGVVRDFGGRWWASVDLWESLHEPQRRRRSQTVDLLRFIDSFFSFKFTCNSRVWTGKQQVF